MIQDVKIDVGKLFTDFARREIESGEFGSTSKVVREPMRRYVAEDMQLEVLKRELRRGFDSGPARRFDWDAFMERKFGPSTV